MQFNPASGEDGALHLWAFWTRNKISKVTADGSLRNRATMLINRGIDRITPRLLSYSDYVRFDDITHTDAPIGYVNIVSGQADYKITVDSNSLDILNLTNIRILTSSSATEYVDLERMRADDSRALNAMSPNPSVSGIPSHFLEKGNIAFLYPEPNYAATNGIEMFFERQLNYFTASDTTKEFGVPLPFQELPVLYGALDWNLVYRTNDANLITLIRQTITEQENKLDALIGKRNPTRQGFRVNLSDSNK